MNKGQGAFEYILLLAGVLLIVVVVMVVIKGGVISGQQENIQSSSELMRGNTDTFCLAWCGEGAWDYINYSATYNTSCTDNVLTIANMTDPTFIGCIYDPDSATGCNETSAQTYAGEVIRPRNARACGLFVGTG
ncbi:class III signal peptide-containing protein [Candidatus Micrarchaeota archaeon]|nr:class III signal peptide-containing protein [Candidatus Micrarchaeota archaeon]